MLSPLFELPPYWKNPVVYPLFPYPPLPSPTVARNLSKMSIHANTNLPAHIRAQDEDQQN